MMLTLYLASIYLPLIPFSYLGLPVTDGFSGWGWSGPSTFGYVLAVFVWLFFWLVVGRTIESVLRRVKPS